MREPGPDRAALRQLVADVNARLGAQLRRRRQLAGLSQAQLAASVGLSPQQWCKFELGQNRISAALLLLALAELQLDPAELAERCLDADSRPTLPPRPIAERLLDRLGELDADQQRALTRFLGAIRPEPLPTFPPEAIAL